jgi:hypothetical protein
MNKSLKFQKLIERNRRDLIKTHGFHKSTVCTWARGYRVPKWETAVKLSILLDVPITQIPYFKTERT